MKFSRVLARRGPVPTIGHVNKAIVDRRQACSSVLEAAAKRTDAKPVRLLSQSLAHNRFYYVCTKYISANEYLQGIERQCNLKQQQQQRRLPYELTQHQHVSDTILMDCYLLVSVCVRSQISPNSIQRFHGKYSNLVEISSVISVAFGLDALSIVLSLMHNYVLNLFVVARILNNEDRVKKPSQCDCCNSLHI